MTAEHVLHIISEESTAPIDFREAETPFDKMGLDSLDFLTVVSKLEIETDTEIPTKELQTLKTPKELANWFNLHKCR